MLNLSYLPDLAPSDLYLFPTMKQKLEIIQVIDDDEFCDHLQDCLADINQKN
jgi:hypothetical protein